jgi:hypothetical protein
MLTSVLQRMEDGPVRGQGQEVGNRVLFLFLFLFGKQRGFKESIKY